MGLSIFLSSLLALAVFLSTVYYLIRKIKFESIFKADLAVTFIGIIYLLFSVVLFLWSFDYFEFNTLDFLIVYAVVLAVQTVGLISILYQYNKNKRVLYPLLFLVAVIPFALMNILYLHLIIPISFFIILLSFLIFSNNHQRSTLLLTAYASFSLLAYVVSLLWQGGIMYLVILSNILFLLFIHSFLRQLRTQQKPFLSSLPKKENVIVHFLKHFVFILIITNFIFIGTVGIHEFGHLLAASSTDNCKGNKIVYELEGFPHTEVICTDTSSRAIWVFSGVLAPLLIAALLYFGGGTSIKEISLQIIGIDMVISYLDLQFVGFSKTISLFILFLGICLFALSLALLARSRTQQ